jgi:uncharacterized SAM-binding protein YcdF (DUF218 family)
MKLRSFLVSAVLLLVLVVGLYWSRPLYLAPLGQFLVTADPMEASDVILVLSGDNLQDERLLHAIRLWRSGLAPTVLLSVVMADWQTVEDYPPWRHVKKFQLMPLDALVLAAHRADSTKEEAQFFRSYLPQHGYKTIILVTSNYHARRAKRVFEKELRDTGIRLRVSPVADYQFDPDTWWTHRRDSRTFFYEFSRTVWYFLAE